MAQTARGKMDTTHHIYNRFESVPRKNFYWDTHLKSKQTRIMGSLVCCQTQPRGQTQRSAGCTITACICCNKYDKDLYPLVCESWPQSEISDTSSDHTSVELNADELEAPLSDISPQLEYLLIKKLDVPLEGRRLYGWQQLGTTFGIPKDDLKILENAYKRDAGSPTKELLELLGSRGKRVSDVVEVLQKMSIKIS